MQTKGRKLILALIGIVVVGSGGEAFKLSRDNVRLQAQIVRETTRLEQIQRKYAEGKQEAEALLRVKTSLEGSQRAREAEMEKAGAELKAQVAALQGKLDDTDKRLAAVSGERDKLSGDLADLKARQRKTTEELDQMADAKQAVEKAKKGVEDKLKKTERDLDRARTKNGELCAIALDLVAKYKNKGILGAMADKEPLTQIGRAKLEEDVQEYKDKIEAARLGADRK